MTSKVLTQNNTNEEVIKKSLFIGVCTYIDTPAGFFSFLEKHQDLSATHNCWAYRIGQSYRFNDDGEISGTAGKPMLAAIDGANFDRVGALVIRHYGGTKLGTGGLARAYGGIIAKNLQQAKSTEFIPTTTVSVQVPFEYSQLLFKVTDDYNGESLAQDFNEQGVISQISIPLKHVKAFKTNLNNLTKGQVTFLPQ